MRPIAVVAFPVVLEYELPVSFFDDGRFESYLAVIEIVRSDERGYRLTEGGEVWSFGRHANVNKGVYDFAMHGFKIVLRLVEILAHVSCEKKVAIKFISPFMIWTNHLGYFSVFGLAYFCPTVATSVMEGSYLTIFAPYDCHRIITHLKGEILAGFFDFKGMPGKNPVFVPNLFKILAIYAFAAVKSPWE
ncbi:hypothetical protein D3C81_1270420 [compost metagenome]